MAPVKNGRVLFNEVPTGYPIPGKTTVYDESQSIDIDSEALNGGFLVKVLVLSIDPYLRGRMREPTSKSYNNSFAIGEPISNYGVGVVLRSENPSVKNGDHLYGFYPFQQYVIRNDPQTLRVLENKEKLSWSAYLGICGMPSETAYYSWKEYAHAKKGDVAFVTTGAGPVGATVIQLAKADGLKVIASAGSDEKVEFMKSLGADVAFNYKTVDTRAILEKEGPINFYWDNVGGDMLEAALDFAAQGAHFIECGMISGYNGKAPAVNNLINIVFKEVQIHGVIVNTLRPQYVDEFYATFPARVASGELKHKEYLLHGLERAGDGILHVQTGKNFGKAIIVVADE